MLDSTWAYDYPSAVRVGRAIQDLNYYWYEDPLADDDIYNFTVGPTHFLASMRPRRPVRLGIDIDFRQANRRVFSLPIGFPDRRVADRRNTTATTD